MGKGKKRKRNKPDGGAPAASSSSPAEPAAARPLDDDDDDGGGSDDGADQAPALDEVDTAIRVVRYLAKRPELFQHRGFKELRTAMHPLVQLQLQRYDPIDYAARASAALRAGKWADALQALEGLRANGDADGVKQGTLQRWVRDCATVPDESLRLRLLDSVLRAGKQGGSAEEPGGAEGDEGEAAASASHGSALEAAARSEDGHVKRHPSWSPPADDGDSDGGGEAAHVASEAERARRVVLFERGAERQPADHRDRAIYACAPGSVRLSNARISGEGGEGGEGGGGAGVRRHAVPHVPGAFVLTGVLSRAECGALVALLEWLGYQPDHPVGQPEPTPIATCEWAVDRAVLEPLFARVRPHLPPTLGAEEVAGLNGHFRCFRYPDVRGAVYRPHIDGSWPRSGLTDDGEYAQDAVQLHSRNAAPGGRSRLTFLVYLNDDFDGGATSFYLPAPRGGLEARGVQPRCGTVLCFPQGNTASLVHEGSEVTRGTKYVIRTDVLYREPPAAPMASGVGPSTSQS